ncbi:hypothetical protein [Mycobacterium xenopi]|uniref:hypothetical protein n=1 Tax=Mycobacterium TaxID=1763 RepID=UPI0039ECF8E0
MGTPLGVIIALGAVAGLIVILMTAANPVGTAIGFVPSSLAMVVVVLNYLCVGPLEPEPPRLLVLAFLWEHRSLSSPADYDVRRAAAAKPPSQGGVGSARLCRAVIMHGCGTARHLFSAEVCLAVYVLSMMPISGLAVVLAVFSRRRQQHMVAAKLPGMVAAGLVTPNETTWLGSMRGRKQPIGRQRSSAGRPPARRSRTSPPRWVELPIGRRSGHRREPRPPFFGRRSARPA